MQETATQLIVTVGENVGLHDDRLSRAALDRKAPAVHARCNLLDYCAVSPVGTRDSGHDGYPPLSSMRTESGGSVRTSDQAQP